MKRIILAIGIILLIGINIRGEEGLSEVQKLKAENIKLKTAVLQCQVNSASSQIESEKSSLEIELRKQLGAKNEEVFDWNTLTFTAKSTK